MMNKKDIAEIRRRLNPQKNQITCLQGCFVGKNGEVISTFTHSLAAMPREESEKYLAIFKRTLSGEIGQTLLPIDFTPEQVQESTEHALLTEMRRSGLENPDAVRTFYERVIAALRMDEAYLILLMHDGYDIPFRGADGETDAERSTEIFKYILCGVCPVKLTKAALSYSAGDGEFHSREADWVVGAPEMGFMFPAFEQRSANIYGAMYYTRDAGENHEDFAAAVFNTQVCPPARRQKETFNQVLESALDSELSMDVVQQVQDSIREKIEDQKNDREAAPLIVTREDVGDVLRQAGVSEDKVAVFEDHYEQAFGEKAAISAVNVANTRQFEVRTPDVVIKVNPERSELVTTRVIDGLNYILIRADEGVEVNGVNVKIARKEG